MADEKKPRVMLAEDESYCRVLLRSLVSSMNCEVVCEATNGVEAVELYRREKPHMLLLDINMPRKPGDEVLREIMGEFPNAFVIMLTSVADMTSIEKCLDLGAANYIRKDTPVAEIKAIIKQSWKEHMQRKSQETKLRASRQQAPSEEKTPAK